MLKLKLTLLFQLYFILYFISPILALPYGPDHYMDAHPRPGIDYYGNSISGPLQLGLSHNYYKPSETTGNFKTLFTDNKQWAGKFINKQNNRDINYFTLCNMYNKVNLNLYYYLHSSS